jgi:hypothetical protein
VQRAVPSVRLSAALFAPLLIVHIISGLAALLAGMFAMALRKQGGGGHATAGTIFTIAMSSMTITAAVLTFWEPDRLSLGAAVWAFYLVHTSRHAAMSAGDVPGRDLMAIGLAAVLLFAHGGIAAERSGTGTFEGSGTAGFIVFGIGATLSLLFDLSLLLRRRLQPRQRIARHLWRMLAAYFLAVTSLFLGQQDDVFWFMAGSPILLLPSLLTIGFLVFWLVRVRFARNWLETRRAVPPATNLQTIQETT